MASSVIVRLGTRGSLLARRQSALVAEELEKRHAGLSVRQIIINTTGDAITDRPLHDIGGKGLFVKEIEQALLNDEIDFAVHSYKDVPVTMPLVDDANLIIAATPPRADVRDVLIAPAARTIEELGQGAIVATSSLRRCCQLLSLRPDLQTMPIRGNIDTRLKQLRSGQCHALILAMAGLQRAGLWEDSMHPISTEQLLPAPGQGALALQCRREDDSTTGLLKSLDDPATNLCVMAERAIVAALEGDCHSPIAALAEIRGEELHLRAVVGARDGRPPTIFAAGRSPLNDSGAAISAVAGELLARGAKKMLHG